MLNTLSGRFLILTSVFVMLAEVLIFVPSVARFREDYLRDRLERSQIASLALLADDMIEAELESELLQNAEVLNIVLRRNEVRQLMLSSPIPEPVAVTYDLREVSAMALMRDALMQLFSTESRVIRVIGNPVRDAGQLIEITMRTDNLRAEMVSYGLRILALSAVISIITAVLLFAAVRRFFVRPIRIVVGYMQRYASAPQDARGIIEPQSSVTELREAEEALLSLQTELTQALRQRERMAQLGGAVARVSHDLRNILATAQLFTDRIEGSEDPLVRRLAPKLVGSLARAVSLCESTLAFGSAEEPAPRLSMLRPEPLVQDVIDGETLALEDAPVELINAVPPALQLRADPEQLYRVILNLVRNARQALVAVGTEGNVTVSGGEGDDCWWIEVADTGPGLPLKARDHLFQAFQGGARKGGTGLGLAISHDLIRNHGGSLDLVSSGDDGTTFRIRLPKGTRPDLEDLPR